MAVIDHGDGEIGFLSETIYEVLWSHMLQALVVILLSRVGASECIIIHELRRLSLDSSTSAYVL